VVLSIICREEGDGTVSWSMVQQSPKDVQIQYSVDGELKCYRVPSITAAFAI